MTFFKSGGGVMEAEQELLRLGDVRNVKEARLKVLRDRTELTKAQERVDKLQEEVQGKDRIRALDAKLEIPAAQQALYRAEATSARADDDLARVREVGRMEILQARKPGRRAIIAKINAALEVVRDRNNELMAFDVETGRLIESSYPSVGEEAVFVPAMDETATVQTFLSAWRSRLTQDGWLS